MADRDTTQNRPVNRWDERYAKDDYHFGTEPNGFLAEVSGRLTPGRALCIADGEGRNSVYLAEQGHAVSAMDASVVGMRKANRLAAERGVKIETEVADLTDYDFGVEQWDLIVSIFCHLPAELRRDVHRRAAAGLRPGGAFLLEAYTPDQLDYGTGGPPVRELLMTLDVLREDFAGLEMKIGRELVRDVVEGRGHRGKAAVVQVLARKR